jgi:hypothetical protein
VGQKLPHFPDRHIVGDPAENPQWLEVAQTHQLDHGARVEIIAHDH